MKNNDDQQNAGLKKERNMPDSAQDKNYKQKNSSKTPHKKYNLNVSKAAKLLGVSASTLRRYAKEGKITSQRAENGYRKFSKTDVLELKDRLAEEERQKELAKQQKMERNPKAISAPKSSSLSTRNASPSGITHQRYNSESRIKSRMTGTKTKAKTKIIKPRKKQKEANKLPPAAKKRIRQTTNATALAGITKGMSAGITASAMALTATLGLTLATSIAPKTARLQAMTKAEDITEVGLEHLASVYIEKVNPQIEKVEKGLAALTPNYNEEDSASGSVSRTTGAGEVTKSTLLSRLTGNKENQQGILASKLSPELAAKIPAEFSSKLAQAPKILGRRTTRPDFALELNVPTTVRNDLTVEGAITAQTLSVLAGGLSTENQGIDTGTGALTAGSLTFTAGSTGSLNNLLTIDDQTQTTLEETLELDGDLEGTLDETTIATLGGADVGDIDSGELLILDGDEITSGEITDLDTTAITELGTISTGTWTATEIGPTYGGTGLTTYTTGDLLYSSASNTLAALNIGTEGYVLTSTSGVPAWTDIASATNAVIGNRIYTENNYVTDSQTVTASIEALDTSIYATFGNRTYTEDNFVTDAESITSSIDALDQAVYSNASGETGLWRVSDSGTYIYPNNFSTLAVTDSGRLGIGTTSPDAELHVEGSVVLGGDSNDTITFTGGVTTGGSLTPAINLGADLGSEDKRFNNIYVENINNNSQLEQGGQAIFSYVPGTAEGSDETSWTESTVRINPTTAPTDSWLFGLGVAGSEVAGIYHDGDSYFEGSMGIGRTSPSAKLHIEGTTEQLRLGYDSSNYTSFTIGSDGELTIADSGTDVAVLGATQAKFSVPTTFDSAGDVSIANDLVFTNQTSANIQSYGPLYIEAGENFENNDLTLKTYGTGNVAMDLSGTGYLHLMATDPAIVFDTATATDTDFWMGVIEDAGGDDDDKFMLGDGGTVGTNPFVTVDTSGNVGIGTTAPSSKLHVYTDATNNSILKVENDKSTSGASYVILDSQNVNYQGLIGKQNSVAKWMIGAYGQDYSGDKLHFYTGSGYNHEMTLSATGLGIGTTSPAAELDVNGDITNSTLTISGQNITSTGGFDLDLADNDGTSAFDIRDSDDSNLFSVDSNGGMTAAGTHATYTLDNGANDAFTVTNTGTGLSFRVNDVSGDTSPFVVDEEGNVGIGTTSPTSLLHVSDSVNGGAVTTTIANLHTGATSTDETTSLSFDFYDSSVANRKSAVIFETYKAEDWSSTANASAGFRIQTRIDNSLATRFSINGSGDTLIENGNLGIGTTSPTTTLHVVDTTEQLRLAYDADNYTSFTIDSSGQLTIADTGTDIATFGAAQASFNVPAAFNSAGDVSIANDLNFTNITASYITSDAPLYIQAGNAAEAESLYLSSAGSGSVYVDDDLYVTGATLFGDGSAAAPSISFEGDSDTGLFSAATNTELGIAVGGSERVRVDASGYVGIGTTDPGDFVDIEKNQNANTILRVTNTTDGTGGRASLFAESNGGKLAFMERTSDSFTTVPAWAGAAVVGSSEGPWWISAYNPNGTLRFQTGGTDSSNERMRIDSSGNIGIGTTAPASTLDVAGTAWLRGDTGDNGLFVEARGNVGIGTTNPEATLEVGYLSNDTTQLKVRGAAATYYAQYNIGVDAGLYYDFVVNGGNATLYEITQNSSGSSNDVLVVTGKGSGSILKAIDGTETAFQVKGDGDVLVNKGSLGIGTTAPSDTLSVAGGTLIGSTYASIGTTAPSNGLLIEGNVGIGTTSPTYTLDVAGNAGIDQYLYHNDDADTSLSLNDDLVKIATGGENLITLTENTQDVVKLGDNGDVDINLSGGSDGALFVEGSSGYVGIGTTDPTSPFTIATELDTGEGTTLVIDASGNVLKDGAGVSSLRYKENITNLSLDTSKLLQLRTVEYDLKNSDYHGFGYIAEELEEIGLTEIIKYDSLGRPDALNYGKLSVYLVEAYKELHAEITKLKLEEAPESTQSTQSTESALLADSSQTPSEILTAIESVYAEFKEFVSALGFSVDEETQTLVAENNFMVLGDTTLSDTTITGDLNVGLMAFDTTQNAINVQGPSCFSEVLGTKNEDLCQTQTLYLQKNLAGAVNIFNGKIKLDPNGTITTKSIETNTLGIKNTQEKKTAGRIKIKQGETLIEVETTGLTLTKDTIIVATPDTPVAVAAKVLDDTKFELKLQAPALEDVEINWWVVSVSD
ncbi:MerR family DNA-binding transcriptional regulator [candidate division WWE3 bacterium]|nr:MerR family DNA-binding transcriptional regulator [candidate division WWE3 bacterium]